MGGFDAHWLALREPSDARARSAPLTRAVAERLGSAGDLHVLDLAAGTGANVRYLASFLASNHRLERWLLVDNDRALLERAAAPPGARDRIGTRVADLATALDSSAGNLCAGRDLVTASALLDLVSERWLDTLARRCRDARAAALFALNYNGDFRCSPQEPEDILVRELVNRHQRIDKGFGPALGPDAPESAARAFAALGYVVRRERSDWMLEDDVAELQARLIEGWSEAAGAIAPEQAGTLRDWTTRRLGHVTAGRSRVVVGHEDVGAWLP